MQLPQYTYPDKTYTLDRDNALLRPGARRRDWFLFTCGHGVVKVVAALLLFPLFYFLASVLGFSEGQAVFALIGVALVMGMLLCARGFAIRRMTLCCSQCSYPMEKVAWTPPDSQVRHSFYICRHCRRYVCVATYSIRGD